MWIFSLLVYVIFGILLYIITSKFNYFVNVVIFIILRIVSVLLLGGTLTFGSVISIIISSVLVVYIAQWLREGFDYDQSVLYIVIVTIVYIGVGWGISAFAKLFS